jgi:two-component system, chemotaxis family, CheB/CheR fusion protein
VLVNDELEILQFRGHAGAFLEPPPGEATHNLLKMAREGLLVDLHAGIYEARKKNLAVLKEGLRVKVNGVDTLVNLKITPIKSSLTERFFLILFEEVVPSAHAKTTTREKVKTHPKNSGKESDLLLLQDELTTTRKYLQSIIEDQEETNVELRSANEEILSANEELQSTNEELETTKEELQATNEELTTVNEELYNRNHELSRVNDDLNNLLGSINLPLIIVGTDLRIRRFTTQAEKVMNVIPGDVGRPFSDLKPNLQLTDLEAQIQHVIETVTVTEKEVQDRQGHWYSIRMRPYRTTDNRIDGVIIVLVDIDMSKQSQRRIQEEKDFSAAIVDTVREPLLVLNGDLNVKSANRSFYQTFHSQPADTEGQRIYDLGNGQWNIPALRTLLEELLPRNKAFDNFTVEHDFPDIGPKKMILNARQILSTDSQPGLILLAMEEVPCTATQE